MKPLLLLIKDNLAMFIIAILIIVVALQRCDKIKQGKPIIETRTVHSIAWVKGDTIYTKPQIKYQDTGSYHEIITEKHMKIDTGKIIKEFLTKNIYERLLVDNEYARLKIYDTVFANRLLNYKLEATYYKHTDSVFTTKTLPPKLSRKLFVGGSIGYGKVLSISPSIMYMDRQDRGFWGGYDLINQNGQVGMWWKLSFRRK